MLLFTVNAAHDDVSVVAVTTIALNTRVIVKIVGVNN